MLGAVATTRTGTSPTAGASWSWVSSSSDSGMPVAAQTRAKASSTSATAGPRISMPVSRQGSMPRLGLPSQRALTHRPLTNPTWPSTAMVLRWSREIQPNGLSRRGGLKARTSPPAARRPAHSFRLPRGAQPVVEDPDLDPLAGPLLERAHEGRGRSRRRRRCSSRRRCDGGRQRSPPARPGSSRSRHAAGARGSRAPAGLPQRARAPALPGGAARAHAQPPAATGVGRTDQRSPWKASTSARLGAVPCVFRGGRPLRATPALRDAPDDRAASRGAGRLSAFGGRWSSGGRPSSWCA